MQLEKIQYFNTKICLNFKKKDKDIKEIEVREKIARSKPKTKQSWPPSLTANDERQIAVQQGLQNISMPNFSTPSTNFNHELLNHEVFNHEHFNHELFNHELCNQSLQP